MVLTFKERTSKPGQESLRPVSVTKDGGYESMVGDTTWSRVIPRPGFSYTMKYQDPREE